MTDGHRTAASCNPQDGRCRICGDEAVAARVVSMDAAARTAVVEMGGERLTIATDLVDARVGDDLLVHMGFAIERLERA